MYWYNNHTYLQEVQRGPRNIADGDPSPRDGRPSLTLPPLPPLPAAATLAPSLTAAIVSPERGEKHL